MICVIFYTDINECDPETPHGGGHNCDTANGAVCKNHAGGYSCQCGDGYESSEDSSNFKTCKGDI